MPVDHEQPRDELMESPTRADVKTRLRRPYLKPRIMWDDAFKAMMAPLACGKVGGTGEPCDSDPSSA